MAMAPKSFRMRQAADSGQRAEMSLPSRQDPKRAIYASPAWRRLRVEVVIRDNYLCQQCIKKGLLTVVVLNAKRGTSERMAIVDHIVAARTPADVLCPMDNLWTLCPSCASIKTASQDGGFGNA